MIISLLVAAGIAWLYAATLQGLFVEWLSSADASYGIVLAAVAGAVVWRRRMAFALASNPQAHPLPGLSTLFVGLCLYLTAQLAADVFLTRISFVVVLTGAIWFLCGGRALRTIAPPLVFLLIAVPLPALIVNAITLPLQMVASRIGETTLTLAGVSVFRDGNLLELPSTTLEIADACSGLRSLVSLTAIAGLLAWTEPSWPRRVALLAAGAPIAIVMNGLRIAATGLACEYWSPRAAADPWHTVGGWLTFVVSLALLFQLQRALPAVRKEAPSWELDPVRA
jgi:exosortase